MGKDITNSFQQGPDEQGRYGIHGGRFVSETLMPLILDLEAEYERAKIDPDFWAEMADLWKHYVGRPSPLYYAERLSERFGGAKIYLKRDELNHTGAHKINNVLGQILLARRMGKKRIIAETGAGQHGVATATVCAKFGLKCIVFMGQTDVERQAPNVFRMKLLGAEVVPVTSGRGTLKDAMNGLVWDDDSQVVRSSEVKEYGKHPGIFARVTKIDGAMPSNITSKAEFKAIQRGEK
ncbi:MAG: pyridoxal-phosphate dependent enzyme [Anaerolineales bacterium]|nr:pyridoxal-phosphate dependent enzyme [Anaerolineales bacterium]